MTSGCLTSPPTYHYRLSSLPTQEVSLNTSRSILIGVGPVLVPSYLEHSQIFSVINHNLTYFHDFHRWSEDLQKQIENALSHNLSSLLSPAVAVQYPWEHSMKPQYQLIVQIRKFEGNILKSVTLEAFWQLINVETRKVEINRIYRCGVPLEHPNINTYVSALSRTLKEMSKEIKREIEVLEGKNRGPTSP